MKMRENASSRPLGCERGAGISTRARSRYLWAVKTTSVGDKIRAALPDVKASADLQKTVRDWLVADGDFNVWFLETTKGALDDAKLMALLSGYGDDQDAVSGAWDDFERTRDEAALTEVLAASTKVMAALKLK
ncbi:MAG: hypothetical protein QOI41_402 [Myxococcales bacterium]|nr:hypothetical protein [Myxococcales bacterium]